MIPADELAERAAQGAAQGAYAVAERLIIGAAALCSFAQRLMHGSERLAAARRARPVRQCHNCGHKVRLEFTGHMSRYRATCDACTAHVSWMAPRGFPTEGSN